MFGFVSLTIKTFAFMILQSLKEMKPLNCDHYGTNLTLIPGCETTKSSPHEMF